MFSPYLLNGYPTRPHRPLMALNMYTSALVLCAVVLLGGFSPSNTWAKQPEAKPNLHKKSPSLSSKSAKKAIHQTPKVAYASKKKNLAQRATKKTAVAPHPVSTPHAAEPIPMYSQAMVVLDANTGKALLTRNPNQVLPMASLTKLMTAMVIEDAGLSPEDPITISEEDVDHIKNTQSRLDIGLRLRRADAMLLALMSSENRAAHAIARNYPGGIPAFVMGMNQKAAMLGMLSTHFVDPTGLSPLNVSTPNDLAKLVQAASLHSRIREFSTKHAAQLLLEGGAVEFRNTNPEVLHSNGLMNITLSKTGYIREAGFCLAFAALVNARPVTVVMMAANTKRNRLIDMRNLGKFLTIAMK
jgi:D-alanyl-D-alanine endopeptidase (penicillin-binding protein 7)